MISVIFSVFVIPMLYRVVAAYWAKQLKRTQESIMAFTKVMGLPAILRAWKIFFRFGCLTYTKNYPK